MYSKIEVLGVLFACGRAQLRAISAGERVAGAAGFSGCIRREGRTKGEGGSFSRLAVASEEQRRTIARGEHLNLFALLGEATRYS